MIFLGNKLARIAKLEVFTAAQETASTALSSRQVTINQDLLRTYSSSLRTRCQIKILTFIMKILRFIRQVLILIHRKYESIYALYYLSLLIK